MSRRKRIILASAGLLALAFIALGVWVYRLNKTIAESLSNRRFIPPVEFYSAPQRYFRGQKLKRAALEKSLQRLRFRERQSGQVLNPGDYTVWHQEECANMLAGALPDGVERCVAFRNRERESVRSDLQIVAFGTEETIFEILSGNPPAPALSTQLEPELFAQFVGIEPMLKLAVDLGDAPPLCLNAILAIEDSTFLEHQGISLRAIGRAVLSNLTSFRVRQGGSTITQQLVK
ncbi:MAG TPA: transglycosylase domain-containing protein, partial [Bdellovibrionales bacterium]|nr:transglycosylase domain-containing protein [Bdellovibrionales bacterium]